MVYDIRSLRVTISAPDEGEGEGEGKSKVILPSA